MAKLNLSAAIPLIFLLLLLLLFVALASADGTTATAPLAADELGTCRKVLSGGGAGWDCVRTVVRRITSEAGGSPAPTPQCCINVMVMDQEMGYCWSYLTEGSDTDGPSKLLELCVDDVLQGNS